MEVCDVTGNFGRWQFRVIAVLFYFSALGAMQNLSVTFLAPNVPFRCIESRSSKPGNRTDDLQFDRSCRVPVPSNDSAEVSYAKCTRWQYDSSRFPNTVISEDLVCDREWLVSLSKSVYMAGFLLSVVTFGQISDCIGRFPTIVLAYLITCSSMFLTLLSSSYTMFAALRFFHAFGRSGVTTVGHVLVMEIVGQDYRVGTSISVAVAFAVGYCWLVFLAWFVRPWFWLQFALSMAFLPVALAYWFIPESPRWLQIHGKWNKLDKLMLEAVKTNRRNIQANNNELNIYKLKKYEKTNCKTLIDIVKMPNMRKRTFNMIYLWMVNGFTYYGLIYNTNDLAGDPYLNYLLMGLLEFPSFVVLYWGLKLSGRKNSLVAIMGAVGCACVGASLAPSPGSDFAWIGTAFYQTGKSLVTASFTLLYLYTNEVYPTVVRNVALGSCSMFARVGSTMSPFVRELGKASHPSVPNILYSFLMLIGAALAFFCLPETAGHRLPDTMEEGENFGKLTSTGETEKEPTTDEKENVEESLMV